MDLTPSRLSVAATSDDDRHLVLRGDIDSYTAEELESRVEALGTSADLVLDLEAVEFIDSSGLRVIINAHEAHDAAQHRLVLRSPSSAVLRLIEIAGLTDHLHLAEE